MNISKAEALALWIYSSPETVLARNHQSVGFKKICQDWGIAELRLEPKSGEVTWLCGPSEEGSNVQARYRDVVLRTTRVADLDAIHDEIIDAVRKYDQLGKDLRSVRRTYHLLLALITLFILFFATWLALFLAKQISVPIAALLGAAQQLRQGKLGTKVDIKGIDELASLVRAFNEMSQDLADNSRELENRRCFTEAILESIPTGVIFLSSDDKVQRVNRALKGLLGAAAVESAERLKDLFTLEDITEIRYLMNRARRMGVAASQLDIHNEDRFFHLSVTVSALEDRVNSGFVIVLEDTTDMLRAQKAAAWHEIARRIAHEIKNPLTPIRLCAERISRQLDRGWGPKRKAYFASALPSFLLKLRR